MRQALQLALLALLATSTLGQYNYAEVLEKSILFYEAQRSGFLPSNNRIDWRVNSGISDAVIGGYYDAGDHVKFGFPMASSITQLAWGAITFSDAYSSAGQQQYMKELLQWGTQYFIDAHPVGSRTFTGQIGKGGEDHSYWGRPEEMPSNFDRSAQNLEGGRGGSDLLGETAAALAASSIYYEMIGDTGAASECLSHARELYEWATDVRMVYTQSISDAGEFYNSWSGFNDELIWAAAWMYKATGEDSFRNDAEDFYNQFNGGETPSEFSWDNKFAGAQLLLYDITGDQRYLNAVNNFLNFLFNEAQYTPKGLIFIQQWGSLRHAGNVAHFAAQAAALGVDTDRCMQFVRDQIGYILGDTGRSYVIGFGNNPPKKPHHRGSSCPDRPDVCDWNAYNSPNDNPQELTGALVGGPDQNDNFNDDRGDYVSNEVATDYNAGFQGAVASLI